MTTKYFWAPGICQCSAGSDSCLHSRRCCGLWKRPPKSSDCVLAFEQTSESCWLFLYLPQPPSPSSREARIQHAITKCPALYSSLIHWVGPKVRSGFLEDLIWKTRTNRLANPILSDALSRQEGQEMGPALGLLRLKLVQEVSLMLSHAERIDSLQLKKTLKGSLEPRDTVG